MKGNKRILISFVLVTAMVMGFVFTACQSQTGGEDVVTETGTTAGSTSQTAKETDKPKEMEIIEKEGKPFSNLGLVTARSFQIQPFELLRTIEILNYNFNTGSIDEEGFTDRLNMVLSEMEGVGKYYDYIPYLNVSLNDELCGALPVENPIGGGKGIKDSVKKGTFTVRTSDELVLAVSQAKNKDVIFIASDAKIDMTEFVIAENYIIRLNDGVTLASDRGSGESSGGMIISTAFTSMPLIEVGENCRITGLTIQGPETQMRDWRGISFLTTGISVLSDGVTVDNCEIAGFNGSAITVSNGDNHSISYNYIHDNKSESAGYGVKVASAKVLIENNLFNGNRTSVYGDGSTDCGLEVRNNIEMGTSYDACIKMEPFKEKETNTYGDYMIISNNTYITSQMPFDIGSAPKNGLEITNNYFAGAKELYDELFNSIQTGEGDITVFNNAFGLAEKVQESDVKIDLSEHTVDMRLTNITSRNYYSDMDEVYKKLDELREIIRDKKIKKEEISKALADTVKVIEGYDRAYEYLEQPNRTVGGKVYGAVPDDQPLGGGYGYKEIVTTGDFMVGDLKEFIRACIQAKDGDVIFVKGDAVIDLSAAKTTLTIKDGVTLASDRGNGNSTGALILSDTFYSPMFKVGENVRITGLIFRGADPDERLAFHKRSYSGEGAKGSGYYYKLLTLNCITTDKNNLEVDNCEFSGFSHAAVYVSGGTGHYFHHNYIHHNQRNGLGYGFCHDKAVSLIEYNLFNANRHDLAGTGAPGSGYEARHNIQMGTSLSHCFDMHGGSDRGDGTDIAGDTILMYNNVFLSDQLPYALRGAPQIIQKFYGNIIWPSLDTLNTARLYGRNEKEKSRVEITDNIFNAGKKPTVVE
ncbi:MAG TPA: hypothetical protein DDZ89_17055 [Clostridiales bacterium]|nr:hypothetical protein [Clostridiales bacterium]